MTIEWFASKVHTLLKELNISTYHVVGHSLGGYIALALAERYPSSLASMTLFHSTAYADTEEKKLNRDKVISFIERNGLSLFMDSFVTPLFAEKNKEKCKESILFLISEGKNSNQDAVISTLYAMKNRQDRSDLLVQFNKPILMIIGENDLAVPLSNSLEQLEINSNIENIILKNCGHMGMLEKPSTCLSKLKEFIFSV
jgi:pimeloyl-ACP methyl ester carboxylesterase